MAILDLRYSFIEPFLAGGAIFTRRAHQIEAAPPYTEELEAEHRACVVASIVQSAFALEAASAEVTTYGPPHPLGKPLPESILKAKLLERYELLLQHYEKAEIPKGKNPYQDAKTLVEFRDEFAHYKSSWQSQLNWDQGIFRRLQEFSFAGQAA